MVRGNMTDVETGLQLRSRFFVPCDVPKTVRLRFSVARALLENLFEHPIRSDVFHCFSRLSLSDCAAPRGAGVRSDGESGRSGVTPAEYCTGAPSSARAFHRRLQCGGD